MEKNTGKMLEIFKFSLLQDMLTLFRIMDKEGISKEDIIEFVKTKNESLRLRLWYLNLSEKEKGKLEKKTAFLTPKCPECGSKLNLIPIEVDNEAGNKSVWRCSRCKGCSAKYTRATPGKECTYEKFDTRTTEEIMKEYQNKVDNTILGEI